MLEELRIRGLGVIDDAVLELGAGLHRRHRRDRRRQDHGGHRRSGCCSAARADAGAGAAGAGGRAVEGRCQRRPAGRRWPPRAEEAGAELDDDGVLLVARTVSAEGRSRAWLGGRSVPVGCSPSWPRTLVAVHGQSDQQRLLQPAGSATRSTGTPATGRSTPLARYREAYQRAARGRERELDELTTRARERAQEADLLRLGLAEIEAVDPQPGEDVALPPRTERLATPTPCGRRRRGARRAARRPGGDPTRSRRDRAGRRRPRGRWSAVREHDPELAELADRLAEVGYLLADVGADLASYAAASTPTRPGSPRSQERRAALRG